MSNDGLMPWQIIQNLVREREEWSSEQILEELRLLPVLPDEDYYNHAPEDNEHRVMNQALYTYLAIVELARSRHLIEAIPLLLERASYGDFGETMRGLPGSLLRIADIGGSAIERLRPFGMAATQSANPGARQWAITALYDPKNPAIVDTLESMLNDPAVIVAAEAAHLLSFYAQDYPELRPRVLSALTEAKAKRPILNTNTWSRIDDLIEDMEQPDQFHSDE